MKFGLSNLFAAGGLLLAQFVMGTTASAATLIESFSWGMSNSGSSYPVGGGAGKVSMSDFHFVVTHASALPLDAASPPVLVPFTVTGDISFTGLSGLPPGEPITGTLEMLIGPPSPVGSTGELFPSEIVSMSVQGGPVPLMLRESPSKASLGRIVTDTSSGSFRISSFFDVFTELSLDGGASWIPADSSFSVVAPVPLPSSVTGGLFLLCCLGLLKLSRRARLAD